mmetsp:Transcript_29601/g.33933  ORF Transcript_29601/g.33933 Transcript_29601/m.33933 type:complete len:393 (+) Transcript_29601:144-1322(+)
MAVSSSFSLESSSRFTTVLVALALLVQLSSVAAAETIEIAEWYAPYTGPKAVNANVGDTIIFNWGGTSTHNVYIHPTGNCNMRDAEFVGALSPTAYTFTADDTFELEVDSMEYGIGKEMFFACDIGNGGGNGGHCRVGQNLIVTVYPEGVAFSEPIATSVPSDGATSYDTTYNTDSGTGSDTSSETGSDTDSDTGTGTGTNTTIDSIRPPIFSGISPTPPPDTNLRPPINPGIDPIPPPNTNININPATTTASDMMDIWDNMTTSEMDYTDLTDDDNITESTSTAIVSSGNEIESSNNGNDDTDAAIVSIGNETESSSNGNEDTDAAAAAAADVTTSDESVDVVQQQPDPSTTTSISKIVDESSSSSMNYHHLPHSTTMGMVSIMVAALLHV